MNFGTLSYKIQRGRARIVEARARAGWVGAIHALGSIVHDLGCRSGVYALEVATDVWLGASTRGMLFNNEVTNKLALGQDAKAYQPIRIDRFWSLVSAVPLLPEDTTFIDLGAGRGRAVLLAASQGFHRVIGVELDGRLAAEANRNVQRWRAKYRASPPRPDIRILHADAATVSPPNGPLLVFLYNPFGATTLRQVATHLGARESSSSSPIYIAYFNPKHEGVLQDDPGWVEHERAKSWVVYRKDEAGWRRPT